MWYLYFRIGTLTFSEEAGGARLRNSTQGPTISPGIMKRRTKRFSIKGSADNQEEPLSQLETTPSDLHVLKSSLRSVFKIQEDPRVWFLTYTESQDVSLIRQLTFSTIYHLRKTPHHRDQIR